MGLGVFVIANDFTAFSVAIPTIEADLHTTLNRAQWVINGYNVLFGVLIVTGGRLADLLGRKRIFMIGASVFALFSLLAGLMPTVRLLIAARALMGVGGALVWPAVLGMTYALLPPEKKGRAGGLIIGVAGLGNTVGPLIGGWLTDVASWRMVFFINLPVTAFAMIVVQRAVPESRGSETAHGIDYPGIAALSAGLVAVLVALDLGTQKGFTSPVVLALLSGGAVLLIAFFRTEPGQRDRALVPTQVLRNQAFAASCTAVLLMSAIFFAALLYLPQFMENVLRFSALRSGAGLLPLMAVFGFTSFAAGELYGRLGPRATVSGGAGLLTAGMAILSFLNAGSSYLSLVPGMIVLGMGVGLFYSSVTTAAVTALDPSRSSLAGGIVYMCQVAGGAIGLGLNTAIVLAASTLSEGIAIAFRVDAGLAAAGLLVSFTFIGGSRSPAAPRASQGRHVARLRELHRPRLPE